MIILQDINGNQKEVAEGEAYNGREWTAIGSRGVVAEQDALKDLIAAAQNGGIPWGDLVASIAGPIAKILGKSNCSSCDLRKMILNVAQKLGPEETIKLFKMTFDKSKLPEVEQRLRELLS